jgi:hypothetical protein
MVAKVWTEEMIVELITKNDKALAKALVALYDRQTTDEQVAQDVKVKNKVGLNAADVYILTGIAKFYLQHGYLSPKQAIKVRQRIFKYRKQLTKIANKEL